MTSFFPFSSSSTLPSTSYLSDDPHLEVTVTPSASAFYAGEKFSATISFRNTRVSHTAGPSTSSLGLPQEAGSRVASAARPPPPLEPRYEPGKELPARQQQIGLHLQPEAGPSKPRLLHLSPALALDESPYSPGANPSARAAWPTNGPTIRSPDQWALANGKGHSRRARSLALGKGQLSPQQLVWALGRDAEARTPPPLPRRPNGRNHIPSAHPHSRKESVMSLPGPSPTSAPLDLPDTSEVPEAPYTAPATQHTGSGPNIIDLNRLETPPPSHPYSRSQQPRTTTILWAYTRLRATFHPNNAYIPPDPLLPLRSLMLHQPVGSGSLIPESYSKPSRWQPNFGTGSIGTSTQPSLTGSLFGLAKDLLSGGSGGSLEEERKRVWNMKDLPVLETTRSLLGVDVKLKEGEIKEFTYTLPLPRVLPPSHRGRAFRFAYDLVVSLTVALPGGGKRQKTSEVLVPIRVWANVPVAEPAPTYDVLHPVIRTKDEGIVTEQGHKPISDKRQAVTDDEGSLHEYAKHLLSNLDEGSPLVSPSKSRILSPSTPAAALPLVATSGDLLAPHQPLLRSRSNTIVDDLEDLEGECGEAVEILSRHAAKSSYDIAKDGNPIATLTLTKTVFRLGESVLGLATFNGEHNYRVLKFHAYLESHEIIPEPLLPHANASQPNLARLHAEFRTGYAINTNQLAFSLDIPSEATPGYSLAAGEGDKGGLEWRVRLAILVSVPRSGDHGEHLVPITGKGDEQVLSASTSLSPVVHEHRREKGGGWRELETETIECEVPIRVLAGNTAFLVRPTVQVV